MKKNNRKGFTIVELVIVIAVIGILAGVMIPTFGSIVDKANNSSRDQQAAAEFKDKFLTNWDYSNGATASGLYMYDGYCYTIKNNSLVLDTEQEVAKVGHVEVYSYDEDDDKIVASYVNHADADAEGAEGHGECDICGATLG